MKKHLLLPAIMVLLMMVISATRMHAKEIYTNYKDGVLTFFWDDERATRDGINELYEQVPDFMSTFTRYTAYHSDVTKGVIDESMKEAPLTSALAMFLGGEDKGDPILLDHMTEVEGLENLPAENLTNMSGMFYGCTELTEVSFGELNTSKVTDISMTFAMCSKLKSVDLSGLNTSNVRFMQAMFCECENLETITFGENFSTENVENMLDMFYDCKKLTSLDLSSFNTKKVTEMTRMFFGCRNLEAIDFGEHFITPNVTDMGKMFSRCESLTYLDLSSFNTGKVEFMNEMFYNCKKLETIEFSENFSTVNVESMKSMFEGCSKLISLDLRSFRSDRLTKMQNMFMDCSNLEDIKFGKNFNAEDVTALTFLFKNCSNLQYLDLRNFTFYKATRMDYMFSGCEDLLSVQFSSKFVTEATTRLDYMFEGCASLQSLDLTKFDLTNVTNTSSMFRGCTGLSTIYCNENWELTYSIPNAIDMFLGCEHLVGENGTICTGGPLSNPLHYARPDGGVGGEGFFTTKHGSEALIDGIYYYLDDVSLAATVLPLPLEEEYGGDIVIPAKVNNGVDYDVTAIGEAAFSNSEGVTSIVIPEGVTSIGGYAFANTGITTVTIPSSVNTIGDCPLGGCSKLTEIKVAATSPFFRSKDGVLFDHDFQALIQYPAGKEGNYEIPDGVLQIKVYAFEKAEKLTGVILPATITEIEGGAFFYCTGLQYMVAKMNSPVPVGTYAFNNVPDGIPVYVEASSLEDYKADDKWKDMNLQPGIFEQTIDGIHYRLDIFAQTATVLPLPEDGHYSGNVFIPAQVELLGFDCSVNKIEDKAFANCDELQFLRIETAALPDLGADVFDGTAIDEKLLSVPDALVASYEASSDWNGFGQIMGDYTKVEVLLGGGSTLTYMIYAQDMAARLTEVSTDFAGELGLPNTVEHFSASFTLKYIDDAFIGCGELTSLTIPETVTEISLYGFSGNNKLTEVNVDEANADYSSEDGVLFDKPKEQLIFYPRGKKGVYTIPQSVEMIGEAAFAGCTWLEGIIISENVLSIEPEAFSECTGLKYIACLTPAVPGLGSDVFYDVPKDIPVYVLEDLIDDYKSEDGWKEFTDIRKPPVPEVVIGGINYRLDMLAKTATVIPLPLDEKYEGDIVIPAKVEYEKEEYNVTAIEHVYYSEGLTSVVIPESVTSIGDFAFDGTGLTNVTIPASVNHIGEGAFSGCSKLTEIKVAETSTYFSSKDGVLFDHAGETLLQYPAGKEGVYIIPYGVEKIVSNAFAGAAKLTGVTLPYTIAELEDHIFYFCEGLQFVIATMSTPVGHEDALKDDVPADIPVFVPESSLEDYKAHIAWKDLNLKPIIDGYYEKDGVWYYMDMNEYPFHTAVAPSMADPYEGKITIPANVDYEGLPFAVTAIDYYAFGDNNVTEVILPEGLLSIDDYAFYQTSITSIIIPSTVKYMGENAFSGSKLTSVTIPAGLNMYKGMPFVNCSDLTAIHVEEGNTLFSDKDGVLFAEGGTQLVQYPAAKKGTDYVVPDGVTKLLYGCFALNTDLRAVELPASLTDMENSVFFNSRIQYVTCHAVEPPVCDIDALYGTSITEIFVPEESVEKYKLADVWKDYPIKAIGSGYLSTPEVKDIAQRKATVTWTGNGDSYDLRYREIESSTDFEDGTMNGWTTIDADGDGHSWDIFYSMPIGYINIASASYLNTEGALTPDNYLVSPKVQLGGSISFYAAGRDNMDFAEHFGVAVSTGSNDDPADFTTIEEWTIEEGKKYKLYSVNLSAYAGQEGYIAIRHFDCTDQFFLDIDDIEILTSAPEWTEVNDISANQYTISGLQPESDYMVQVRAKFGESYSEWMTTSFKTLAPTDQSKADDVKELIDAIGTVTYPDSKDAIDKARIAYDALTTEQQALVTNYTTLEDAETAFAELKKAADDKAAADAVDELIGKIGEVEYTAVCKGKIDAARTAYDALTTDQKALVANLPVLEAAEKAYADLKAKAEADQKAADAVIDKINEIGEVAYTDACKTKIDAARDAFNALTDDQKALVLNHSTLTASESLYELLKASAEAANDQAMADIVIGKINDIGTVAYTTDSKALIDAARAAYDALTAEQKALVSNYAALEAAEKAYADLKAKAEADKKAADEVIGKIDEIGEVAYTDACKTKIDAAREAYNTLTDDQKALVANLPVLEAAEKAYADLKAAADKAAEDKAAADDVIGKIDAIGEVSYPFSQDAIETARAAYDALTNDQKKLVDNIATLTAAETLFAELKAEADKESADLAIAKKELSDLVMEMQVLKMFCELQGKAEQAEQLGNAIATATLILNNDHAALAQVQLVINSTKTTLDEVKNTLFAEAKDALNVALDALLVEGDSEACKQIIEDAKDAVNAQTMDEEKSIAENIAALQAAGQAIYDKAKADLEAQRKAEETPTGLEDVQRDDVQCTKVMKNGVLYIIRDGKTFNVNGQQITKW